MRDTRAEDVRHVLIHQNREQIEVAALKAMKVGFAPPIVLLIDLSDEIAARRASTFCATDMIDSLREHARAQNGVPVIITSGGAREAVELLSVYGFSMDDFPVLDHRLLYHCVVLTRGKAGSEELRLPE